MKKTILSSFASLLCLFASAQDAPFEKIAPVSPQSAALGKFQEIPVGNYTGIPQTSIPIYTVQSKEISVPISLDYHGGGIKVSEVASNVGLGWALSCGGAIIQQVRGLPDQGTGGFLENSEVVRDFHSYSEIRKRDIAELVLSMNSLDTEPDIFFYNFNGKSGKLFFGPDGHTVYTIPRSKIQANFIPGAVSRWEIIAEDGFKYIFGMEEVSVSTTPQDPNSSRSSTWYLSEIISPNSTDVVTFGYRSENYSFTNLTSAVAIVGPKTNQSEGGTVPVPSPVNVRSYTTTNAAILSSISFPGGNVKIIPQTESRLDLAGSNATGTIEVYDNANSLNRKINLFYSYGQNDQSKRLFLDKINDVDLSNLGNDQIHAFSYALKDRLPPYDSFSQDHWGYFNSAGNLLKGFVPTTLLTYNGTNQYYTYEGANRDPSGSAIAGTLTGIKLPTGGTIDFNYEPNTIAGRKINLTPVKYTGGANIHADLDENMQPRMQYDLDFEIKENNTNVEITFKNGPVLGQGAPGPLGYIYGPDGNTVIRMSYAETNKLATLAKKGKYRFSVDFTNWPQYVENFKFNIWFLAPLGVVSADTTYQNEVVGGLRIYKITVKDPVGQNTQIKKYLYSDVSNPMSSSGTLVSIPKNVQRVTVGEYPNMAEMTRISSFSNLPLSTTSGGYVGYSHVIELLGENGENGKNEYFYTSPNGNPDKVGRSPYRVTSREHHRGKLTEEVHYKFENNKFIKIKSIANFFEDTGLQTFPTIKFAAQVTIDERNIFFDGGIYANYGDYDTETDYYNQIGQRVSNFVDSTQVVAEAKSYTYNSNNQVLQETITDSRMRSRTIIYSYPSDMVQKGITIPYQEMNRRNMLNTIIEQETRLNDISLEKKTTLYSNNLTSNNQLILPSEIQTKYKTDDPETRWRYYRYDLNGNPLSVSKEKGIKTNYIWSYKGLYLVAEITGIDYSTIETKLGALNILNFSNTYPDKNTLDNFLSPLKLQFSEMQLKTFNYKPLVGMISETDPKGQTTYYEYDGFQRLRNVKDQNKNILKNTTYNYKL